MEPKKGAVAVAFSSACFLALGLATGGPVFYAAFLAAIAVLLADGWRCAALRSDLRRRLAVARELPKSEMLLGSDLPITYRFDYRGRRIARLSCVQAPGAGLEIASPPAALDLRPGTSLLSFAARASGRGRHTVPGLEVSFESLLFSGSLTAGDAREIEVYPVVDVRPGRMSRGSRAVPALDVLTRVLAEFLDLRIEIGVHSDAKGDAAKNRDLAQRRADAVKAYLVGRGIQAERIQAAGKAPDAANRRVEVRLLSALGIYRN
jgi:uncharacterized protein (DUF58 family)